MKKFIYLLIFLSTFAYAATIELGPTVGSSGTASPLTTKGDVWGYSTTNARIPIGTNGQVLTADSTQTLGLKWAAVAGSGTVTSVDMSVPAFLTISGNPITSSGTLAVGLSGTALPIANGGTGSTSFTAGSVPFSNGTALTQDNANLFWDDTDKALLVGSNVFDPTVSFATKIQASSDLTDASNSSGIINAMDFHVTVDAPTAYFGIYSSMRPVIDTGITMSGGVTGFNSTLIRTNASDLGSLAFGAGYVSQFTQNNGAKNTDIYSGFLTGFHNIDAAGTVANMYDFYAAASTIAGGAVTNRYGIVIEPDSGYTKSNWLSGNTQFGGVTLGEAPSTGMVWSDTNKTLIIGDGNYLSGDIFGTVRAVNKQTDPTRPTNAAWVGASATTYTDDSTYATIASYNLSSTVIPAGKTNSSALAGVFSAITRQDAADEGTQAFSANFVGSITQSGPAKVTNMYATFLSGFHNVESTGVITNMYDFYAIGGGEIDPGGVTNRYGIVIEADTNYTKKNWLSGQTVIGGSSATPTNDSVGLELAGTTQSLLLSRMDEAARDALTAVNGMVIYNTDSNSVECYQNGSWGSCAAGGGGANTALSNLITTSINQDLQSDSPNNRNIGAPLNAWQMGYINLIKDAADDSISYDVSARRISDSAGTLSFDGAIRIAYDNVGNPAINFDSTDSIVIGADLDGGQPRQVHFNNEDDSFTVGVAAPNGLAQDTAFVFPPDNGVGGYILQTDGSGVTSWAALPSIPAITTQSGTPTVGSCGTGPSVSGTDSVGTITVGTGVFTSCTLTFAATWGSIPRCFVNYQGAVAIARATPSTTDVVIDVVSAFAAGSKIDYECINP